MRKTFIFIYFFITALFILSCGQMGPASSTGNFPSPGAPEGNDALSSTTNQSGKEGATSPKLDPLAAAGFIAPPQVNNYGSVSMSYPVRIPAGRAGLQPSVGIGYSSSGGDGLVGIGWSLSTGLGVISRTTNHGELHYDYRDIFTYNGKRLIKVSGPDKSEEGVYRAEIESDFSRFELSDASSGGVWHMYDKAGRVTVFGSKQESRIYFPDANDNDPRENKTYIWNFDRIVDLNGNFMSATYDTSAYDTDHILYLTEIRYTGNEDAGLKANQYVKFIYTDRDDAYVSKAPGFVMKMDQILASIEVGWDDPGGFISGGTVLWTYTMEYDISSYSYRPLLTKIDSTAHTTSPAFTYTSTAEEDTIINQFSWKTAPNETYNDKDVQDAYKDNPGAIKYFEGDFNGDGLSDFVFFNYKTFKFTAAEAIRGGGFVRKDYSQASVVAEMQNLDGPEDIQWFKGNVTGDYNGDGRSDIAFYLPKQKKFYVAQHNGQTFDFVPYSDSPLPKIDIFACEWFPGDFDSNGISDAVLFNEPTGEWIFMQNIGGGFHFTRFAKVFKNLYRDDYSPSGDLGTHDLTRQGGGRSKVHFLMGDYNGDSRTDILMYDDRDGTFWVALNNLDDYNGFRLDWVRYKTLTAQDRQNFFPNGMMFGNDQFSGDWNGDGFSDLLFFDRTANRWILGASDGSNFNFTSIAGNSLIKGTDVVRWFLGDFTGDGRTDIGYYLRGSNVLWVGEATPSGFNHIKYLDLGTLNSAIRPDLNALINETPLPDEEVVFQKTTTVVPVEMPDGAKSLLSVQFPFDANPGIGERVFTGSFKGLTSDNQPCLVNSRPCVEQLIYTKGGKKKGWYFKSENDTGISDVTIMNVTDGTVTDTTIDSTVTILNNDHPISHLGKDALVYYQKAQDTNNTPEHTFHMVRFDNEKEKKFIDETLCWFSEDFPPFDINKNMHLIDDFNKTDGEKKQVLVINKKKVETNAQLALFTTYKNYFKVAVEAPAGFSIDDMYANPTSFTFMSGKFTKSLSTDKDPAEVLIIDRRDSTQKYYLGIFSFDDKGNPTLTVSLLDSTVVFDARGYTGSYRVMHKDNASYVVYGRVIEGIPAFDSFRVTASSVSAGGHVAVNTEGVRFEGDYDAHGNPVVLTKDGYRLANFMKSEPAIEAPAFKDEAKIDRTDLVQAFYPYQWIQGDYNGDGKTDIGIFHLLEKNWYFATSQGMPPDIMTEVNNGIGGRYTFNYIHSSSVDNNGPDGIPHLPMNYLLCSELYVEDGQSGDVLTTYEYKGGYAFSSFINGFKETDYFGFSEFRVNNGTVNSTVNYYNNVYYKDDFRMNRALAGALKESVYIGRDRKEYTRTVYDYTIHTIVPPDASSHESERDRSYLVEPTIVQKFVKDLVNQTWKPVETRKSNITLTPAKYEMTSKLETVIDHYTDELHEPVTVKSYSAFSNIESSNEMRLILKKDFYGTNKEVSSSYGYDSKGNLIEQKTSYTGKDKSGTPDDLVDQIQRFNYDSYGNVIREINASGSPERIVEKSYDKLQQFPVSQTAIGDGKLRLTTKFTINYSKAFGAVERAEDPNGNSVYYAFDGYGRILGQWVDTDNGKEKLADYIYNAPFERGKTYPLSAKVIQYTGDGEPIQNRVYVDGMGRVIHSVRSALNENSKKFVRSGHITYDSIGRVISQGQTDWAGDTEIDVYNKTKYEKNPTLTQYENAGRVEKVTLPKAYKGEPVTSISYQYSDPWVVKETHSVGRSKTTVKNARGLVMIVEDSGKGDDEKEVSAAIGFEYDITGKRIKKYDISADTIITPGGTPAKGSAGERSGENTATWSYDGLGRVVYSKDPDMGEMKISYTPFGEVKSTVDSLGRVKNMRYDRLGRVIETSLPGNEGSIKYFYDGQGASVKNSLGRITQVADLAQTKHFYYDSIGRVKSENRFIAASGTSYTTDFSYDLLNRTKTITYPQSPESGERYQVKNSYSAMGITGIIAENSSGSKPIVSGITYNEFGQMTSVGRGNGTTTNYEYDIKGRLMHLKTIQMDNGSEHKVQDVAYTFRIDNSIAKVVNTPTVDADGAYASTVEYNYQYDGLNRLINADGSYTKDASPAGTGDNAINTGPASSVGEGSLVNSLIPVTAKKSMSHVMASVDGVITRKFKHSFAYAPNGNLMQKNIFDPITNLAMDTWDYEYGDNGHAVQNITSSKYQKNSIRFAMTYDNAGNMIKQDDNEKNLRKNISYDSFNRIKNVIDPVTGEMQGSYEYDHQGLRVRKIAKKVVDGLEKQVEILYPSMFFGIERERNLAGRVTSSGYSINNIYLNGVRVAALAGNGEMQYYLTDQIDSVKVVVDDKGKVLTRSEYLPFGETWFQEGDTANKPKYNSQELDEETNFYYMNARYQDPQIGRFVTADNIIPYEDSTQSWNRYSYCRNNPIIYKDPTGHFDFSSPLESIKNGVSGKGFVSNETANWGAKQEKNIKDSFASDSRLATEKKVAEMEAKGLNTDKLQNQLTDMRKRLGCNKDMSKVDKALLGQYKEYDLTGKKDTTVVKPLKDSIISSPWMGVNGSRPDHTAIDLWIPSGENLGKSAVAAKGGVVISLNYQAGHDGKAGGGQFARIRNNDGTYSDYMHLQGTNVTEGQKLTAGDRVGSVGNSGSETLAAPMDPHLHYQEMDSRGSVRRPTEVENLYR